MKIIYGRAGTGKSEFVFNEIKKWVSGSETSGSFLGQIYIITPEQFSFTAEKRLLESLDEGATMNVEVLSFDRMAYRVIKETMQEDRIRIGKSEKAMIIFDAISKHQNDLQFLGKSLENVETIITQITEFKKHNITVESLEKQVEETNNQYIKAKLNDMLIMYRELENKIEENFIDENDLLTLLADNIKQSHLFDNAIFYIDEFAGFTKQEYSIIQLLDDIAKELYITVCSDDLKILKSPEADIFYDNKQNIQTLCQLGEIDREKQIYLEKTYRFKNEELNHLEENFFSIPFNIYKKDNENINLFLAENPYTEVEHVASQIIKLVREQKYRYRDFAVICNNLETYSSLCKAIFSEYEIPVFIDDKKDITQNVIIKYVLAVLDIFAKSWSYDSVFNYLKTGLVGIDNIFELENYCLKWGIKGKKFYQDVWNFEKNGSNYVEEQQKLVQPLLQLRDKLNRIKTAKDISEALYSFLVENLIRFGSVAPSPVTQKWVNCSVPSDPTGDPTIIFFQEDIEAFNLIITTMEQIAIIFRDQTMSFEYYSKILKTGLSAKELGQIPQTQDKVTVGDVNRSKTHKVKAVFIIGVNDGVFPSIHTSEGFFNDKDRQTLKEQNFELAKGTKEKMYEENFNIYKAFSTAVEKLIISYSSSDSDGRALRKSLLISKLKRLFPNLVEFDHFSDEVLTKTITFSKLLNNLEEENWNEVYKWYEEREPQKLKNALNGVKYTNIPLKINNKNIEKLYGTKLRTSVSKLESYMSCPFSYFLKYGLKISEKEKLDVNPIDTGSFMHEVIDQFFKFLREKEINIRKINDEQINEIVKKIVDDNTSYGGKFTLTAKYRILLQRLTRVVTLSIKYIVGSLVESEFEVLETEAEFDNKLGSKYQPIEMKLDDGRKVSIIGKIDRIDIAKMPDGKYIRIIDYKSSTKDIDLNKVIAGLQLQLITYTDAVCENDNAMPAGALYFTLIEPKIAQRNLKQDEIEELLRENYRMNGLVLADVNIIKAMDTTLDTGKSSKIPVTLNTNGEINFTRSKTVTREEFENLQKYTNKIIKEISKQILTGDISLKPYYTQKEKRTPCQFCSYKSICQFNSRLKNNDYRYISNRKKQEILQKKQ